MSNTVNATLAPISITSLGAIWARAVAVEKELCNALPENLIGDMEGPLLEAFTAPVTEITRQLLALDAANDAELLIQARAAKHVRGTLA